MFNKLKEEEKHHKPKEIIRKKMFKIYLPLETGTLTSLKIRKNIPEQM